jgi:hypothetical protein
MVDGAVAIVAVAISFFSKKLCLPSFFNQFMHIHTHNTYFIITTKDTCTQQMRGARTGISNGLDSTKLYQKK